MRPARQLHHAFDIALAAVFGTERLRQPRRLAQQRQRSDEALLTLKKSDRMKYSFLPSAENVGLVSLDESNVTFLASPPSDGMM